MRISDWSSDVCSSDLLPGNGHDATPLAEVSLQRYVEHVGALIETLPGTIQLVAHSGGGVTPPAVAEAYPERVPGVASVAGMMLPSRSEERRVGNECVSTRR